MATAGKQARAGNLEKRTARTVCRGSRDDGRGAPNGSPPRHAYGSFKMKTKITHPLTVVADYSAKGTSSHETGAGQDLLGQARRRSLLLRLFFV